MGARGALVKGLWQAQSMAPIACRLTSLRAMSSRLFVGGLSFTTEEEGLRNAFGKHGEVVDARIVTDRESGRSRGFGFVTFLTEAEADAAKDKMNGQFLDGRVIRVDRATPRPAPPPPPPRSSIPAQEDQSSPQDWGTIPSPMAAVPQNAGLVQGPGAVASSELPSLSSLASAAAAPPAPITGTVLPPAPTTPPPPSASAPPPVEPARPSFSFNFDFSAPDPNFVPRPRPARLRPSMMDYEFGFFSDTSKFPFNTNFGTGFLRVRGPEAEFDFSDIKEALALKKAAELAAKQEAEAAAAAVKAKETEEAAAKQPQEAVVAMTQSSLGIGESPTAPGAPEILHTTQKPEVPVQQKDSQQTANLVEEAGPDATHVQQKQEAAVVEECVEAVSTQESINILHEQKVVTVEESTEFDSKPKDAITSQSQERAAVDKDSEKAAMPVVSASVSTARDIIQNQEIASIVKEPQEASPIIAASISPDHTFADLSSSSATPVKDSVAIGGAMDLSQKQNGAVCESESQEAPSVVVSSGIEESQEVLVVTASAHESETGLSSSLGTPSIVSASSTEISQKQEVEVVEKVSVVVTSPSTLADSYTNSSRKEADPSEKLSHAGPAVVNASASISQTDVLSSSSTSSDVSASVPRSAEMLQKQVVAVTEPEGQESIPTINASVTQKQTNLSSEHPVGSTISSQECSQTVSSDSRSPVETDLPQLQQVGL